MSESPGTSPPASPPLPTSPPAPNPPSPPASPPAPVEFVPLKADAFKLPDGAKLAEPLMGKFVELANGIKLPGETAQKLVDLQIEAMNAASAESSRQWEEMQVNWRKEAEADPVIGGEKLKPAVANVAKLIDAFALGPDGKPDAKEAEKIREVLDLTGLGDNPTVIRFLSAMAAKLVAEGAPVPGSPGSVQADAASIMFPSMAKG